MKKNGKYLTCPVCNKSFYRKASKIKRAEISYCSHKCKYKHNFIRILKKAIKSYPEPWQELISQWYITDKISIQEITKKLGLSNRVIPKALKILNIPQRSIHDRIALQWKDNPKRRREQGKRTSRLLKGHIPWNKGLTKKEHPSINKIAESKIGIKNPMYGKFGKASPRYKNGKYTAEKKRFWSTSKYQQWRKAVYKRDNYTCQKCGDNKGGNLNAHHIKSFVNYPKLRYKISNGITLCDKCHQFTHQSSIKAEIEHRQEL